VSTCERRDRWRRAGVGVVLLLSIAAPLGAQQAFPYRLRGLREGILLGTGAATFALAVDLNARMDPLTTDEIAALDPATINGFDRPATERWAPTASHVSDAVLIATVGGSMATLALAPGEAGPTTIGVMFGETILLGNGISELVKTAVRRTRPYAYNDDPDIPLDTKTSKTARQSFPSGHTINAFASAVFLSSVYSHLHPDSPARPWIWGGSLAAAGTVGYLRYSAGKHFPTDIITGAVLGGVIGWVVPEIHESDRVSVSVAPGADGTILGLSVEF
jgi:membrane-associated phospholipid phosphatase